MLDVQRLFVTEVARAELGDRVPLDEIEAACRSLAEDDEAGRAWCRRHGYTGYTSYASLSDLPWRFPAFKALVRVLDGVVAEYARSLEYDLKRRRLSLNGLWVNVLPTGGAHSGHIHPYSAVSGTLYVAVPPGAGALRFEDPRLGLMMAAPPRKPKAARERRAFVAEAPRPGTLLLWESWLRHEVLANAAEGERISVSFNYA